MSTNTAFVFSRIPELHFGAGKLAQLPALLARDTPRRQRILLVTGSSSFVSSAYYEQLTRALDAAGVVHFQQAVAGEPSPELVDQTVARYRDQAIDQVVAIGGGSAMDAGKAISAMLPQQCSVTAYLEGMESAKHDGRKTPFMAIPTSSGTGSEATKNAVLSRIGEHGFKASLRHDNFIPDSALIDPELMLSCPPDVTAACGLDALTQLIEAYVSSKASPLTDALALSGLTHFAAGFERVLSDGERDVEARGEVAYAAFLSGVTLANAGLGVVHGCAGPLGAYFPIPHGVACGTLLGEATRATIDELSVAPEKNRLALEKYARVGTLLAGRTSGSLRGDCAALVATLEALIERCAIGRLSRYGISRADLPKILDLANNKNSPATLKREQIAAILAARL